MDQTATERSRLGETCPNCETTIVYRYSLKSGLVVAWECHQCGYKYEPVAKWPNRSNSRNRVRKLSSDCQHGLCRVCCQPPPHC
jgi:ribosomal protein L37AE/L43A